MSSIVADHEGATRWKAQMDAALRIADTGTLAGEYVYRNRNGRAIAVRGVFEREAGDDGPPLRFSRWRRPDDRSWAGMEPMLPADLPLFGGEALRDLRAGATVLLVDDEPTAIAARDAGVAAVCLAPGLSGVNARHAMEGLEGFDVLFVPTADGVGIADAEARAKMLGTLAVRRRIAVVEGAKQPGELCELFRRGLGFSELEAVASDFEKTSTGRREEVNGLVRAADIRPERQEWLWRGFVPLGTFAILDGDPGEGKSSVALDLAARVTTGRAMPDDSRSAFRGPRDVVIVSSEDRLSTTTIPRLMAADADMTRVHFLVPLRGVDGTIDPFELPRDVWRIEEAVEKREAVLVVVESLMETLAGETNTYSDHRTRRALAPVREAADRLSIAIVAIRHLNKGQGKALYRGGGSIAFAALARAALLVAQDHDDATGQRRVLAVVKNNLARRPGSLAFHIEGAQVEGDDGEPIETQRVVWDGPSKWSADELVAPGAGQNAGVAGNNDAVAAFLLQALDCGPVNSTELMALAEEEGISGRTLRAAAKRLGIVHRRQGFGAGSHVEWELRQQP